MGKVEKDCLASPEISIYICDNIKQILLKVLKNITKKRENREPITQAQFEEEQNITCQHFSVF